MIILTALLFHTVYSSALCQSTDLTNLTPICLNCICEIESSCNPNIGCLNDLGTLSCGPYQIKEPVSCCFSVISTFKSL